MKGAKVISFITIRSVRVFRNGTRRSNIDSEPEKNMETLDDWSFKLELDKQRKSKEKERKIYL